MQDREGLLSGILTILGAGLASVLVSTFIALLSYKIFDNFLENFGKKVASDVEKVSLETWESKDS